ncbi:MAG: molybdopterin converting factor subunit 1 [Chloroflexota bacterium]|nr:molybdopterin converting factor subunit 1 [Chloroflexota bacterium]
MDTPFGIIVGHQLPSRRVVLNITLRLFAGYRERVGQSVLELTMPDNATVGSVAQVVFERYPGLIGTPNALVIAVNQEYQQHDYALSEGDEVALIPPVSGGSDD